MDQIVGFLAVFPNSPYTVPDFAPQQGVSFILQITGCKPASHLCGPLIPPDVDLIGMFDGMAQPVELVVSVDISPIFLLREQDNVELSIGKPPGSIRPTAIGTVSLGCVVVDAYWIP